MYGAGTGVAVGARLTKPPPPSPVGNNHGKRSRNDLIKAWIMEFGIGV